MKSILVALALCVAATAAQAGDITGATLMEGCEAATHPGDSYAHFVQGYCVGVIRGVFHMAMMDGMICPPPRVTNIQTTLVVLHWERENPKWLHEELADIALVALRQAWPCQQNDNRDVNAPTRIVPR